MEQVINRVAEWMQNESARKGETLETEDALEASRELCQNEQVQAVAKGIEQRDRLSPEAALEQAATMDPTPRDELLAAFIADEVERQQREQERDKARDQAA